MNRVALDAHRRWSALWAAGCAALACASCGFPAGTRNGFLTQAETFGSSLQSSTDTTGGGGTSTSTEFFRETMTVTFVATNSSADPILEDVELNFRFAAWVSLSNIRSASQTDALLRNGYVQITSAVQIGTAFTLPAGTYVFARDGAAVAGSTVISLPFGNTRTIDLITPDVLLVWNDPPVSCDSVAYDYTVDGEPLESLPIGGNNIGIRIDAGAGDPRGPRKTYAQIDRYQCDPFEPGLFLHIGGGVSQDNEFFEGESVQFDFDSLPDANGNYAVVTIQ